LQRGRRAPVVEELRAAPEPVDALAAFADLDGVVLLHSALWREDGGRYSFLCAAPFCRFHVDRVELGARPLEGMERALGEFSPVHVEGLPPFQGGAAGLLGYELGHAFERLPRARFDELRTPALAAGLYDWVIAWDHAAGRAWIISHGFARDLAEDVTDCAAARVKWVRQRLVAETAAGTRVSRTPLLLEKLAPQYPVGPSLTSDFSREAYLRAVERAIESIYAGDIFQTNLSQRLLAPLSTEPVELYRRLQSCNPAPFAGYLGWDDWAVLSASPERFVRVDAAGEAETRPIKGTRQRRHVPEADLFSRDELRESAKDQAENLMIVDLLRNDFSRVCEPGSVQVPRLCSVEMFETVQHLVSVVRGKLAPGKTAWDLLRATFPGGSVTGAPKIRAMEIIAELEPTARGPYCGSLFYCGYDGVWDSNILIRTFTVRTGWVQCPVGGGIVAQSDPRAEYEETWHKAEGMLRALS
jgi:para-aminobenzoate synthetase component 1